MLKVLFNNIIFLRRSLSASRVINNNLRFKHSYEPKYIFNMNEAYLRYDEGNETFTLSFRYTNYDFNVDRQFNMVRKPDESIAVFLRRLDSKIDNIVAKKKMKKKKKQAVNVDEVEKVDNVETGNIELLRNDTKIHLDETCETLFCNTSEIKLKIFDNLYEVRLNVPWILSMSLPKSIMVGFPTYPADFETVHTDKNKSLFIWYINCSQAMHNSSMYKSSWEQVGEGFFYTPKTSDISSRLKLKCTPVNNNQFGPVMEVESCTEIEAGPCPCPFETRHAFTREKLSGKDFRVTSYNILADVYASTEYSRDVLFPYCPPYALAIDYRKQLIIKELIGYNSDIICLQEVGSRIFETDLQPVLSLLDYDGIFTRKGEDLSEGVATFYNEKRFDKICSQSRILRQDLLLPGFASVWERITNKNLKDRFLARNTTVQVTVLRSRENPNEILVVGNTHLYFQQDADHIRLLQGYFTLCYCREIAKQTKLNHQDTNVNIIICGDFNSTPDCGIYQLMTTKHVPDDHKDWSSNAEQRIENVSLSHDLTFASACGTPQYTNFTVEFADCLDYIFYQTDSLEVTQVVPLPSYEELSLNKAIPSVVFPSDHVALCADLKWTGGKESK